MIQKSMSLRYEPSSEPLHIYVKGLGVYAEEGGGEAGALHGVEHWLPRV